MLISPNIQRSGPMKSSDLQRDRRLVEFAIVVFPLLAMIIGTVAFGMVLEWWHHQRHRQVHGARHPAPRGRDRVHLSRFASRFQVGSHQAVSTSSRDSGSPRTLLIQDSCGRPKRSNTRSRKCSKLNIPKARAKIPRNPVLNPSARPLLARVTK